MKPCVVVKKSLFDLQYIVIGHGGLFFIMRKAINTDKDGNALCIKASYFKNAAYSTLTQWGGEDSHYPVTGVLEIDETDSVEY